MLRLARLMVLLALGHLPCAGPMVAAAVWVPLLEPLCSAAVL